MLKRRLVAGLGLGLAAAFFTSCGDAGDQLLLGATTSVQDAGLLDALVERFEDEYGYDVKPIVQGSGQVLELARRGELDVIMTHSPAAEQRLIDEGYAIDRTPLMRNYFVIVGPEDDPAGVRGANSIVTAFTAIAAGEAAFVSRGDGSGTNVRELAVWEEADIFPESQSWYRQSAAGQGQTLSLANDEDAYTLVDSSTFTTFQDNIDLVVLYRDTGDPNVYSVVRLNPDQLDEVNSEAGDAWLEFMTGAGQQVIAEYGREEHGEALFEPLLLN